VANDPLAELMGNYKLRLEQQRPVMVQDLAEQGVDQGSELEQTALAFLELSRAEEWVWFKRLIQSRIEYYNGVLCTAEEEWKLRRYQGAYQGLLELFNMINGTIARGKQIEMDRKEGVGYAD
jgi:hypothetical protein